MDWEDWKGKTEFDLKEKAQTYQHFNETITAVEPEGTDWHKVWFPMPDSSLQSETSSVLIPSSVFILTVRWRALACAN